MNKNILLFVVVGVVAILGYIFVLRLSNQKELINVTNSPIPSRPQAQQAIDYKASFAIFTYGTFRVFTASMYHNLSEDIYIQADNPNVVLVKKSGVTWNDFFKTLPFSLTKNCLTTGTGETFCSNNVGTLRFYLNNKEDPSSLDKQIRDRDQLLVTYGNETEQQIKSQLQKIPVAK